MNVIPYDFTVAKFKDFSIRGYWVTFYLLFDGKQTYTFAHQHDLLENATLCRECGIHPEVFTHKFLVTKDNFKDIYDDISAYVSSSRISEKP